MLSRPASPPSCRKSLPRAARNSSHTSAALRGTPDAPTAPPTPASGPSAAPPSPPSAGGYTRPLPESLCTRRSSPPRAPENSESLPARKMVPAGSTASSTGIFRESTKTTLQRSSPRWPPASPGAPPGSSEGSASGRRFLLLLRDVRFIRRRVNQHVNFRRIRQLHLDQPSRRVRIL